MKKILSVILTIIMTVGMAQGVEVKETKAATFNTAISISANGSYSGTKYDGVDIFYKFTVGKSGTLTLTYYKYSDDAERLYLYNNEMEEISRTGRLYYNSDRGCIYTKETVYLIAGTYYFKINEASGNYSFTLNYENTTESFPESQTGRYDVISQAKSISLDTKYTGLLGSDDEQDFYKFTVPFDGVVSIKANRYSTGYQSRFFILDIEGEQQERWSNCYDENKGAGFCDGSVYLKKGTYYLKVANYSGGLGPYDFTLSISPDKTTIKRISRKKTIAKVKIKKQKGMDGYQIQYSTSEKFKKKKTKGKFVTKTKVSIGKLKKRKMYYFRIRAYKKWNGKTHYGEWSDTYRVYASY